MHLIMSESAMDFNVTTVNEFREDLNRLRE